MDQTSALKSKMTKYLGIMYKLKFIIPLKVRLHIYQSFVHSHLNFCSSGVIVDEKLKWTKHISVLKSKMTKYLGIVYKLKFIIPLKARLLIYQSFVHSHLNFCSSVWGFAAKSAPSKKPDTVHGQPVRRQVVHG